MDMKRIAVDSLVGILLFVFVEIGVLLLLFQRYCPLDVNAVNKKILERIV
jgi:hypothetical protein